VAAGLDNLFIQVSANKHDIFSLLCVAEAFDLEALVFNCGQSGHRALKCPNKEDF
jgi:hypothetical protein